LTVAGRSGYGGGQAAIFMRWRRRPADLHQFTALSTGRYIHDGEPVNPLGFQEETTRKRIPGTLAGDGTLTAAG
jgi:hypothetical protein